jgi:hypothetical protein
METMSNVRIRKLPLWGWVVLGVTVVSLLGNATWGAFKSFHRAVAVVAKESRKKEAVKCTDSRIPYDIIPVVEEHEDKFPFEMIMALIYVESRGNPKARSNKALDNERHRGLMMVSINHCKEYGIAEDDLDIPRINVWAGIKVLIARKARWGKSKYQYICAFNCPDDLMKRHFVKGKRLPDETEIHWRRYQVEEARYGKLMRTGIWMER